MRSGWWANLWARSVLIKMMNRNRKRMKQYLYSGQTPRGEAFNSHVVRDGILSPLLLGRP